MICRTAEDIPKLYQMVVRCIMVDGYFYVLEFKHVPFHKRFFDFLVRPLNEMFIIMVSLVG